MTNLSRRSIAQGAAWSIPAVTVAAAAPASASSPPPPTCPTCLSAGDIGAFTAQAIVVNNKGLLAGNLTANIDARACDLKLFKPAYALIGSGSTLTMSDGSTYNSNLSGTAGAGTLGRLSALNASFSFSGVSFPDGTYLLSGSPVHPTQICVKFRAIFIRILGADEFSCEYNLCYKVDLGAASGLVGRITHDGTINYTGTLNHA